MLLLIWIIREQLIRQNKLKNKKVCIRKLLQTFLYKTHSKHLIISKILIYLNNTCFIRFCFAGYHCFSQGSFPIYIFFYEIVIQNTVPQDCYAPCVMNGGWPWWPFFRAFPVNAVTFLVYELLLDNCNSLNKVLPHYYVTQSIVYRHD